MTEPKDGAPFRLAIRHEGGFVNAYLAKPDSMEDSVLIGSLALGVARNRARFDEWKAMLVAALDDVLEDVLGTRSESWSEGRAPEHERSGHG